MQRALLRLEAALTDQAGEPPTKVVREAQEVELPEFLAESRAATLWGAGQLLILRRVDLYPAGPAQGPGRVSGPPRAPGLGGAPGRRPEGQGRGETCGVGAAGQRGGGPGLLPPAGRRALPVADPGGPAPGEEPDPGGGPAPGGDGGRQSGGIEPGVGKTDPLRRAGGHPHPRPGDAVGQPQPHLQHLCPGGRPGGARLPPAPGVPGSPAGSG